MMNVSEILKKLQLKATGTYDNNFYIIPIENSNEYAKMYTKLDTLAINTEYPSFGTNTSDSTVKITNYFELEIENDKYSLFLIADFNKDEYYLKIGGQ